MTSVTRCRPAAGNRSGRPGVGTGVTSTASSAARARTTLWAALVAILLAGCGVGQDQAGPGPSVPPRPDDRPTGADELVMRVESCCGMVRYDDALGTLPSFSLLSDGFAYGDSPVAFEVEPALPPVVRVRLDEADVERLLAAAAEAGFLADEIDFGEPRISDVPTTRLTVVAGGRTFTQSAYALGVDGGDDDLSARQRAHRRRLERLVDRAEALLLPGEDYLPERITVYARAADTDDGGGPPSQAWPVGDPATWEVQDDLGDDRCRTFDGAEAEAVIEAADHAPRSTLWTVGASSYELVLRPLLPDESDPCPAG